MTYSEKLKDERWIRKRDKILMRDAFECQDFECTKQTKELHVHHVDYLPGHEPWEYPDDMLITLCAICHKREQGRRKAEKALISTLKMKGFLLSDLMNFACKMDTDLEFTQTLLNAIRNGS